jgi:hypothetical protein
MGNDILQAIPTLEQDIPADQFMVQNFWEPFAWACAVLVPLAALAAWWIYRRRNRVAVPGTTPLQDALTALSELDADLPAMRECALRLSMILRSFLAGQAQDPAIFETHEEFSQRMDSLTNVPVSCQLETRDLLDRLVEFKYAGETEHDTMKAHGLIETARQLVSKIEREQAKAAGQEEMS